MGGILSWHWCVWRLCSADKWTVIVLQEGYRIPLHHLRPVSLVPCSLRAVVLRSGVGSDVSPPGGSFKMLQKEAVEPVNQSGPGYYIRLFVVEKVMRGWRPVIDLLPLNVFITVTKFRMETVAPVLRSIRQGDWMFSIDLKDTYF